ncbi:LAETG motif-containing sortase-dependent surface protein [Streptomyces sp. UNOC14_S4]|uniref:LAETG motif-containing sortase-dependent surface protein n=1 Tax=Streptomyces sp. UNOC14_S4 TaxID=2872340 RepID=UPI001E53E97A|nr:LAETG motif-containing sortase-dependent surface protein [Streptomyces sp. UNOC14_S4]MCC3770414.1 LPXTG cell wall anchor domain-containing protein [Streptomyces sp. UNOC14_S4]
MKLRRALATAAVTAAIGPAVLLSAPTVHAATGDQVAPGVPAATTAPGDHRIPGATKAPVEPTPGPTKGESKEPTTGPTAPEAKPSASASASASASSKPPAEDPADPATCEKETEEERSSASLHGLPSKVVAGAGWQEFTYRVSNVSKVTLTETVASLYFGSADLEIDDVRELAVTVEWYDKARSTWVPIQGEGAKADAETGFATVKNLKPGEYADARMRIKAGAKAKPGAGYFSTISWSTGADRKCGYDKVDFYDVDVLAAGSKPGKVDDATGKPEKPSGHDAKGSQGGDAGKDPGRKPAGQGTQSEIPVSGSLAKTGSSSDMPLIAGIGGAAVVVGAGALFVVKRRKNVA